MLILDRGVWVKFENDGKLEDGIIECKKPVGYSVFCKDHMNEPINICSDRIKFVKVNDLDGETYYANYRLLNEYVNWPGQHINKGSILAKTFYNELCLRDVTHEKSYYYCDDPVAHYGVKRHNPQYINYYMRHEENASRNRKYNHLDYTKYNPKHVLLNGRYTTVVWEDGSHTVVKLAKGEEYDPEKAILYAIIKHMNGDVKAETDRYLNRFIDKTIYQSQSKKEFLKDLDAIDAAGGLNQEYNPDEDETFFDDEEDGNDTE